MSDPTFDSNVRAISRETDTPLEIVAKLYADTWAEYNEGARIHTYLSFFVAKRVKASLLDAKAHKH